MKSAIALALLASTSLYAQTNAQNCFTIKDSIDRKYCIDKYLQSVKNNMAAEKKSWGTAVAADVKESKTEAINADIQAKKDQKSLLDAEIALQEKHLADLSGMQVAAAAAPAKKKKEKKKKKNVFGIKL